MIETKDAAVIGVLGAGRFGSHLAFSLEKLGLSVLLLRRGDPGDLAQWTSAVSVLCLACRDDQLPGLVEQLAGFDLSGKVVLCHSGAVDLAVLDALRRRGAMTGKFHPLMAFTQAMAAPIPAGTPFAIEGPIAELVSPWVQAWQGKIYPLEGEQWHRYHLAAVYAANFLPLFVRAGAKILAPLAKDPQDALDWLAPLIQTSIAGALDGKRLLPFSGPAVRGDQAVLAAHEALLASHFPDLLGLYQNASLAIVAVSRETLAE